MSRSTLAARQLRSLVHTESAEGAGFPADASHLARAGRRLGGRPRGLRDHGELGDSARQGPRLVGGPRRGRAAGRGRRDRSAQESRRGLDGHGENAAASVTGGLVAATVVDGRVVSRHLPLDPGIELVVVIPDRMLETKTARAILPEVVPFSDAVFNLGRLGLLIAGLGERGQLLEAAGEDRLHQDRRSVLYPEAPELMARLREAGAVISCWSGAGPSLLGICRSRSDAERVRDAGVAALAHVGLTGRSSKRADPTSSD